MNIHIDFHPTAAMNDRLNMNNVIHPRVDSL
jgi:hypothetical protein